MVTDKKQIVSKKGYLVGLGWVVKVPLYKTSSSEISPMDSYEQVGTWEGII